MSLVKAEVKESAKPGYYKFPNGGILHANDEIQADAYVAMEGEFIGEELPAADKSAGKKAADKSVA